MSRLVREIENKNRLISEAQALATRGLSTPENKAAYEKLTKELDEVESLIVSLRKVEDFAAKHGPVDKLPGATPVIKVPASPEERKAQVNEAFRHLLRNGYRPNAVEQRDITISDGDALVPQEYAAAYTSALAWWGPIATLVSTNANTTGRVQKLTISDDIAATMTYLPDDTSTVSIETDPVLRSAIPGTDNLVTTVTYSLQLLEDAFSLEAFIRDIAGIRVARAVEYALLNGKDNGTNTALPNSPTGGLLGSVSAGVTAPGGSLAGGPTYSLLSQLKSSVDHAFAVGPKSGFLGSQSVYDFLIQQTDSTGRPLYKHDPATGLLIVAGSPFYVASNAAMAAYNAASSPICLFGDFSRAYAYQNGGGMRIKILAERYIEKFEAAAVIYHRIGAAKLVSGAVKSLVTAAS